MGLAPVLAVRKAVQDWLSDTLSPMLMPALAWHSCSLARLLGSHSELGDLSVSHVQCHMSGKGCCLSPQNRRDHCLLGTDAARLGLVV